MITGKSNLRISTSSPPSGKWNGRGHAELLEIMQELEVSLERGRKALLALDLAGIEQECGEQRDMAQRLRMWVMQPEMTSSTCSEFPSASASELFLDRFLLEQAIHLSRSRILQAVRLQRALLQRAQCRLRVLGNMLAGPAALYHPCDQAKLRSISSLNGRPLSAPPLEFGEGI